MFSKILIANRGEIAVRIIRTARRLGITSVAVYSAADADALHVREADESVNLGGGPASSNYLNVEAIVAAAVQSGAEAVHPGYGFLAENAGFAQAVVDAGLVFVGPSPEAITTMGEKVAARNVAIAAEVPLAPGTPDAVPDAKTVLAFGEEHGYPLLIKAAFGGGGRGMRQVYSSDEVEAAFDAAVREATAAFGNGSVYVERYLAQARHVELQVIGDSFGTIATLGDRDCSVQRRHQKLIEEAPAPGISDRTRAAMADAATRLAQHVSYTGAGTVEFLLDGDKFYFLEMNTRVQVEHPVTEMVTGVDIIEQQLRVAAGLALELPSPVPLRGAAIEARINAEAVEGGVFRPAPGPIDLLEVPEQADLRWDGGYVSGDTVQANYDSLVGKLIAWGSDRDAAIDRLHRALGALKVEGISTTAHAIRYLIDTDDFRSLRAHTTWLETEVTIPDEEPPMDRSEVFVGGRYYRIPVFPEGAVAAVAGGVAVAAATATGASRSGGGRRSKKAAFDGRLVAPMQGTIVKVAVQPGESVEAGQVLFVLEAMKMENPIAAPVAGTVAEVTAAAGDSVPAGTVLAQFEAEGS
ncbi:acetyl/propionyl/methylcrotonyl-CoA carboxylase subunit alpha [Microbacterium sp. RD1]|uniref:acetyl/propionyl/methylcrotonyl-CoA carboxylase subunit alpha n=1 Tax=Microbacterium sp. RD1 TaxID=3457313 RepID=UPI003FA5D47A